VNTKAILPELGGSDFIALDWVALNDFNVSEMLLTA
jgi:hypothetical protein